MEKKEFRHLHSLYRNIANYQGLSLEETDYDDFDVEPNQIHQGKMITSGLSSFYLMNWLNN